jgi:GntR family transcriptional repressor for pyruvate dehydrogenase complex
MSRSPLAIMDRLSAEILGWSRSDRIASAAIRFAPLASPKQSEEVAKRIGAAIREGLFKVGDRLPSERALAAQFGLSRPTIRSAIRELSEAGVVTVRPGVNGGIFVDSELVPVPAFDLQPDEIDEILEARRLIMPRICEIAALFAADADYSRMSEAIAFGRAALGGRTRRLNHAQKLQLNISCIRFDLAIADATRNRLLVQTMRTLLDWLEPLRLLSLDQAESGEIAMASQDETLAALKRGDPAGINDVLGRRMSLVERAWEKASGRAPRLRRARALASI